MNSGIITKIEYRIFPDAEFTTLTIIPFSGKFVEEFTVVSAGRLFEWNGNFDLAKIDSDTDTVVDSIAYRKAQFRITDGNGTKHLVGDEQFPARMFFSREVGDQPGAFNGYRCSVVRKAPKVTVIDS